MSVAGPPQDARPLGGTRRAAPLRGEPATAEAIDSALAQRVARDRDVLLRLLSVTASLAGLCIAALGFLEASGRSELDGSHADEFIAIDALLFVSCVYLILWALRTGSPERAHQLSRIVDVVFLFALTSLLIVSAYVIFWIL